MSSPTDFAGLPMMFRVLCILPVPFIRFPPDRLVFLTDFVTPIIIGSGPYFKHPPARASPLSGRLYDHGVKIRYPGLIRSGITLSPPRGLSWQGGLLAQRLSPSLVTALLFPVLLARPKSYRLSHLAFFLFLLLLPILFQECFLH